MDLLQKNAYLKALAFLQEAAEKLPENPEVLYHLGMTQFKNGDRLKGKKTLESAFQLSPTFSGSEEARATLELL